MPHSAPPTNAYDAPVTVKRKLCGRCARPLDRFSEPGRPDLWLHLRPEHQDHEPLPVDPGVIDMAGECDFCSAVPITDVVLCRDFEFQIEGMPVGQGSQGNWGACADCADLIREGKWGALITRVMTTGLKAYGASKEVLAHYYIRLRANMQGIVPVVVVAGDHDGS